MERLVFSVIPHSVLWRVQQIDYFKDCVIKYNDYNIRTGASYKKPEKERFGIADFLIMQYDYGWLKDYFSRTDITGADGHRVFARNKDSRYRRITGVSDEDYRKNYERIGNSGVG